jgi:transcriptional regulator with XRE-family HTH domain/tetratricopeptide (TPR) repeat protein
MGEDLGALLRRYRVAANLTQEELAEKATMSATAVAALERGRRRSPRMSTLRHIALALDLNDVEMEALTAAAADAASGGAGTGQEPAARRPDDQVPGPRSGSGAPALPRAASRSWRTAFVGRSEELDTLARSWTERRRLTLVVGEPGVGKTRLVSEFAQRVHDDGAAVAWGRCNEAPLGPYMPFVEILRQLIGPQHATNLSIPTRGELSRLLPELADPTVPAGAPSRAEAGTEQRLLFEAVAEAIASRAPVLVVVDDLHWADDATLTLLRYLAVDERLREVTLLGTVWESVDRTRAAALADIGRQTDTTRVALDGFGHAELSALVIGLVGSMASPSLVDSVAESTGGNPFFAEELTVHLMDADLVAYGDEATLRPIAPSVRVPERVRDALAGRLFSLPQPSMDFLLAGSVIGREFSAALAGSTAGLHGLELVEAIEDGLLSGLIVESEWGRVTFSHALVQEAVRAQLSSARQASIHRKVAVLMEEQWPHDPALAVELARHWREVVSFDPGAAATAATWSVRAGDLALASAAADEAIVRYQQASELWTASTAGHADAVIRLGGALAHAGRADEADARFRQALHMARGLGDHVLEARAVIGLGRRFPYWETDPERTRALEDALAELPSEQKLLKLTLSGLLVTHLINGFAADEARRRDQLAAQLAEVAQDPGTTSDVLLSVGRTRFFDSIEDPRVLNVVAQRLRTVAESANDLRVLAGAQFAQALAALDLADIDELRRTIGADYKETAERLGDPREVGQARMAESTIALIEGRYDDGSVLSSQALELSQLGGDLNAGLVHFAQGVLRSVDLGEAAEVLELLRAATEYQRIPAVRAGTALCAAMAGDESFTRSALLEFCESGFNAYPLGADRLAPIAFLAHACGVVEDAQSAKVFAKALADQHALTVRIGPLIGWWGPVDHHLGVMHKVIGDLGDAERHLRQALQTERQMGARPFQARTMAELAVVLGRQERPRDPEEAQSLKAEALSLGCSLDAPGIVAEVTRSTVGI